jgi:hypothetical protein
MCAIFQGGGISPLYWGKLVQNRVESQLLSVPYPKRVWNVVVSREHHRRVVRPLDHPHTHLRIRFGRVALCSCERHRLARLRFNIQNLGFRVQGSGFRVQGSGFRVQGSGCRVQGSGFRVQGSGFRVHGVGSGEG